MEVAFTTNIGKVRKNNEDAFYVDKKVNIFIVADGMGGHNAGKIASSMAVELLSEMLTEEIKRIESREEIYKLIINAIHSVHKRIKEKANREPQLKGMGTTVVIAIIKNGVLYIANVGDSRAYIIDSSGIKQITEEHSIVSYLLRTKKITEEEAKTHPQRHVITQAVGVKDILVPYINDIPLKGEESILLCTDGLTDLLRDEEIYSLVINGNEDMENIVNSLVEMANEKGGKDNITVILAKIDKEGCL